MGEIANWIVGRYSFRSFFDLQFVILTPLLWQVCMHVITISFEYYRISYYKTVFLDFLTDIISLCSLIIACKYIPIHFNKFQHDQLYSWIVLKIGTLNSQRVLILNRPHYFVDSYFNTFWPLEGHMTNHHVTHDHFKYMWTYDLSCHRCHQNVTKVTHFMLYEIHYLYHM